MERRIRRSCGLKCVNLQICLRHWHTARRHYLQPAIANASANVTIARFTSMTPARRGRVAGAACSYAGIGLRLQHTQLASARTDKKVSHVYSGLSIVVKSRNALVAPADQVCAETYFLELIPTNAAAVTDNRRREADFPLPVRTFFLSQQRPRGSSLVVPAIHSEAVRRNSLRPLRSRRIFEYRLVEWGGKQASELLCGSKTWQCGRESRGLEDGHRDFTN